MLMCKLYKHGLINLLYKQHGGKCLNSDVNVCPAHEYTQKKEKQVIRIKLNFRKPKLGKIRHLAEISITKSKSFKNVRKLMTVLTGKF